MAAVGIKAFEKCRKVLELTDIWKLLYKEECLLVHVHIVYLFQSHP